MIKTILPHTLTDLQLDFLIVPMDKNIAQRLQRKVKLLSLLMIDALEFSSQFYSKMHQLTRCVLFVRTQGGIVQPDYYKKIIQQFTILKKMCIEISEQAFESLTKNLEFYSRSMSLHSSQIQGLPQDQISQLPLFSGYANCSSVEQGYGNSSLVIQQQLTQQQLPPSNSFINTMIFAIHDFNHNFSPTYSEQMRCESSLALNQVIPATMYTRDSDSYAPIQMLPPICDDPTNSMFYVNDCRPIGSNVKNIPIPRLIIRGSMLLPSAEQVIKKNEDFNKTVGDIVWVYKSYEQYIALATHSIAHIISSNINYAQNVCKILHEQTQFIKSGSVKKIDFQVNDFVYNLTKSDQYNNIQSLSQIEEPEIDFKNLAKAVPYFLESIKKQLKSAIGFVLQQQISKQESNYLNSVLLGLNENILTQIISQYCQDYSRNACLNPDFVIDFDEFGILLASNLKIIIFRRLIAGFYNSILVPNKQIYFQMQMPVTYMSAFDRYRMETKEFKIGKHFKDVDAKNGPLSQNVVQLLIRALDDIIYIRPTNQPELKDSIFIIPKNGRIFSSYMLVKMMAQFIRLNKNFRDKPLQMNSQMSFNQFYCIEKNENDNFDQNDDILNILDIEEEDVNQKTNRDRFRKIKIAEDTTKGKCSVCPQVFNNYKEHVKSNLHKLRYQEELQKEQMIIPLRQISKTLSIKDQVRTQLSHLCIFICAKEQKLYAEVAKEVNSILLSMAGIHLTVDPEDEPRSGSPTCRSTNFRAWREKILRFRVQSFEEVINSSVFDLSNNDYVQQIVSTLVYASNKQQNIVRQQQLRQVITKLLLLHPQLGKDNQINVSEFNDCYQVKDQKQQESKKVNYVDQKLYMQSQVIHTYSHFSGVANMLPPENLFGQLSCVSMLQDERVLYRFSDKVQLPPQTFSYPTLKSFDVQQEWVKQMLMLEYSPKFDVWFQFSFNKFADEIEFQTKISSKIETSKIVSTIDQTEQQNTVVSSLDEKLFLHNKEFLKQVTDKKSMLKKDHNYTFMQELRFELEQQEIKLFNKPFPVLKYLCDNIEKEQVIDDVSQYFNYHNRVIIPPILKFQAKRIESIQELFSKALLLDVSKENIKSGDFDNLIVVQQTVTTDQQLYSYIQLLSQKSLQIAQLIKFAELNSQRFTQVEQYLLDQIDEDDDDDLLFSEDWGVDDSTIQYQSVIKYLDLDRQEMEMLFNKQQKLKRGNQKLLPFVYQPDIEQSEFTDPPSKPCYNELIRSNSFSQDVELDNYSISQVLSSLDDNILTTKEQRIQTICSLRRQPNLTDYKRIAKAQHALNSTDEFSEKEQTEFSVTIADKPGSSLPSLKLLDVNNSNLSNLQGIIRGFHFTGKYVSLTNINPQLLHSSVAAIVSRNGPSCLFLPMGRIYDSITAGILCQISEQGSENNASSRNIDSAFSALLFQCVGTNIACSLQNQENDKFITWSGSRRTVQRHLSSGPCFDVE